MNVPIVTDSQHSLQLFEKGSLEAWGGLGAKGISDFYSYFSSSVFLISFCLFPGRAGLLTGSQTGGVRMISFRMVGAFLCEHCLKLYRPF